MRDLMNKKIPFPVRAAMSWAEIEFWGVFGNGLENINYSVVYLL